MASETHGVIAEFKNPSELVKAAKAVHEEGYKKFDAYSPFPIHGMDKAMGLGTSRLTFIIFLCGVTGGVSICFFMWWCNTIDYPMVISGKPFAAWPAYVPVTFEITVLLSAFGALLGMLGLNRLPRFWDALFSVPRFERASDDGFFIAVEAEDPKFNAAQTSAFLQKLGGSNVTVVTEQE
jgi:hypothetical protein